MNTPLVSVCMPAYNAGRYIGQAVESVLQQTYHHIELIIVNDGSTDNTAAILAGIGDSRVKVLHQANKGQCAAANAAFKASSGGLIKFMDADDLISAEYIENQVKRLAGRTDAIASAAWGRFYNDDITTFRLNKEAVWRNLPGHEWLVQSWRWGNTMMQCALWLIPRAVLEKAGLWDESLSLINDFDFFTRIILNSSEVLFEENAVLYYRSGIAGSLSDTKSLSAITSAFKAIDQGTQNLLKVRTDGAAKLACANTWQQLVYSLYPQHKAMTATATGRIDSLGGADLPYPGGGLSGTLLKIFNWKTVQYLKYLSKNKLNRH